MRKFFRFIKKVALTSALIFTVIGSNGGYFILSTLHLDMFADTVQTPLAQAASIGDGYIIYDQTTPSTNIQERAYTVSDDAVSGATSPFAGTNTTKHVRMRSSEKRDELILGVQDSAGTLTIYMKSSAGSWASQWSATVGDGNLGRFDIGYEKTSGDALVVYSGNTATDGQELKYYTWNGSSWTGPTNLGSTRTTGTIYGIKMEDRSTAGTNEIGLVYEDTNFDISANVWTGSAWYGEPAAALSVNGSKIGTNTVPTNRNYALAFESLSGDLMVIWGEDAVLDPKYVIKPAGGAWGSVVAPTMFTEEGTMMDIAASPNSDRIGYVNCTDNGGDCDFSIWSGSAWGTAVNDATSGTPTVGDGGNNIEWLVDGANEVAVYTYNDAAAGGIDWYTSVNGAQPVQQTDNTAAPAIAGADRVGYAKVLPGSPQKGLFAFGDANADIFLKRATLSGTTVAWSNPVGVSTAIETNTSVTGYNSIAFAFLKYVPNTLTIGATAGSMATNVNSGDVNQYANSAACASAATCSAFTLGVSNTSVTVTSIKITQTGTANATNDLSNIALFYDTDGNYSNGVTGQYDGTVANFTANTATFNGSLALTPGTTYYFYPRYDAKNGSNAPKGGQTVDFSIAATGDVTFTGTAIASGVGALAGSSVVLPNATGTTYGSGLSDGGRSYEAITISGYGFGAAPGGSRANCAGGVDTGCVRFIVGGNATVVDSDVTAWSNTSITFAIDPGLASNGGAGALEVVAGSQGDVTDLSFIIYPNVTGMTVCVDCGTNAAREHAVGDTDGLIMLQGDHLGSAAGTVSFTGGFGSISGAVHGVAEGPCTTGGWSAVSYSNNTICVEVSSSISNSVYTGTVTVTRNADSKTDLIDLRILPRIISNSPISGVKGDTVQILGDHLCESGTCPIAGGRSTVSDHVLFGATQAPDGDFLALTSGAGACNGTGAAWTHTEICVKVPTAVSVGSQPTEVTSNSSYTSNTKAFSVLSTIPNDPTGLNQYQSDGVTPIAVGGWITSGDMIHEADLSATLSINMALQIESKPIGTPFACGAGDCADTEEGTVVGGGACTSCTSLNNAQLAHSHPDGAYHWQARVRNTTTNEYSNWVSFGGNAESEADYYRDVTPPAITSGPSSGTPGTNSATITWGTSGEQSTSQVQYNKTGTFVTNCATNNDCTALDATLVFNHSMLLSNLDSNATYYYRVRSKDGPGNETIGSVLSFTTTGVTQPAKSVSFHIIGRTTVISGGGSASPTFAVPISETSPEIKSAFVEISGISGSGGTNNIQMQMNGQAAVAYAVDASAKTHFKILYKVDAANVAIGGDPAANTLTITPSIDVFIASARLIVMYAYTP